MPTSYPLPSLAASVTPFGITAPSFDDILSSLKASFRLIYGEDAYLEADSQDGQLLAIFARALHDCNMATIAAYNSFSPQTAVGNGLSNVVKINHMQRLVATKSQINLTLVGQAGTTITSGIVGDDDGNRWLLPSVVTIPPAGTVIVTATAEAVGALGAPAGSATRILTPTAGWQSVTNITAATPGQPVESDAALRARQEITPALNSYTVITGLAAAIKALPGVTYGVIYENDTNTTDGDGIPAHSIACVVKGGVAASIAQTIYERKGPGVGTHGTTTVPITDVSGAVRDIKFFIPTEVSIKVGISLVPGVGYTTNIGDEIKQAVVNFINGLEIGEDLVVSRLYGPALLNGSAQSESYKITLLQAALAPSGTLGTADVSMTFTQKAVAVVADVTITLV
jgi:uncharacterized phage protein gp47/JayE